MIVYLNLPYDYYISLSLLRQHYFRIISIFIQGKINIF